MLQRTYLPMRCEILIVVSSGHYWTDVSVASGKVYFSLCLETLTLASHYTTRPLCLCLLISEYSFSAYSMNFFIILYFLNVVIPQDLPSTHISLTSCSSLREPTFRMLIVTRSSSSL